MVFLLLYIIPIPVLLIKALSFLDLMDFGDLFRAGFMALVLFAFMAMTGTLFLVSPIAFSWMWLIENGRALWFRLKSEAGLRHIAVATLCLVIWVLLPAKQVHEETFKTYEHYKETDKPELILSDQNIIKAGLVNAYLRNERYIDRIGKRPVSPVYNAAFGSDWDTGDRIHDFLFNAILYHGGANDDEEASRIYQELFDAPIERGEGKSILHTLGSTFEARAGEATLLSIDQKVVQVTHRDVNCQEIEPGWVQVDFHERYINKTTSQQEIFYYFSMPESGVITGMWLSDDDSLPRLFPAQVAPRGAAQAVYQEIREIRQDPALLEQVGPNQFRLRVFPIPERPWRRDNNESVQRPMHLT
ncbi:MAG: TIGR02921 family PEP-CTERM protein, partial [Bacteroidia bacterium]